MKREHIKAKYVKKKGEAHGHIKISGSMTTEHLEETIALLKASLVERKQKEARKAARVKLTAWQKWKRLKRLAREDFRYMLEDACASIVGSPRACDMPYIGLEDDIV